jgi:hypothetical protein
VNSTAAPLDHSDVDIVSSSSSSSSSPDIPLEPIDGVVISPSSYSSYRPGDVMTVIWKTAGMKGGIEIRLKQDRYLLIDKLLSDEKTQASTGQFQFTIPKDYGSLDAVYIVLKYDCTTVLGNDIFCKESRSEEFTIEIDRNYGWNYDEKNNQGNKQNS